MNVVGLITEYNPFHNGHMLHLQMAKKAAQSQLCIAVMSGNFVQRGEPALFNKWVRTQMALSAGVDLVIELPTAYATRNAQFFAWGAVGLLHALGVVTHLCFGSESGNLLALQQLSSFLNHEDEQYRSLIKGHLSAGCILPKARSLALEDWVKLNQNKHQTDWSSLLSSPNNVLGLEYLAALQAWHSPIQPLTIPRLHTNYHDCQLDASNQVASATAIRQHLLNKEHLEQLATVMPATSLKMIKEQMQLGAGPIFTDNLSSAVLAKLRSTDAQQIGLITDIAEGLENRIKAAAHQAVDWHDLVSKVKTKRYTWSRIQRLLCHFFLGYNQDMSQAFDQAGGPQYIRVLGFNDHGRQLLGQIKGTANLPIITHPGPMLKHKSPLTTVGKQMLSLDILATELYCLMNPNKNFRTGGLDYCTAPVKAEIPPE